MQRVTPDPETAKLLGLLPETAYYLNNRGASIYRPPGWVKEFLESPREIEFSGKEGGDLLDEWRKQTEDELRSVIERGSWGLLHLLGLLRRLPQDGYFLGESRTEGGPRFFNPYLANVAERAALKYARWDAGGAELKPWQKGPSGFAHDAPSIDQDKLAEILVLERLAGPQFAQVENLRKTLARGGEAILRRDGTADSRQEPVLERRFDLYDRRRQESSFLGSTAGTFQPPGSAAGDKFGRVLGVVRTSCREGEGKQELRYERLKRTVPKWDKRFQFSQIDLRPVYDYLKLLEDEVTAQYRLTPELIVTVLLSLGRCLLYFLGADFNVRQLEVERLISLDRRGYLLVSDELMDGIVLGRLAAETHKRLFPEAPSKDDPAEFAHGFKRLAYLDSYRRGDLSLEDGLPWVRRPGVADAVPMPPPFVYPAGSHRIVDLNVLSNFVQGLCDCLVLADEPRKRVSKDLELRLNEYFGEELTHSRAFDPSKKLWHQPPGGRKEQVAELDVSIRVGSVLVAIDAKSIRVSSGYRKYRYGALKTRWQKFERYVEEADEQADKLSHHPRGTNYDLLAGGYTHVVTLLCSAMPEYIDTDDENFYVRSDLPRVAAPLEMRSFLNEVAEEELKALPFAKQLRS